MSRTRLLKPGFWKNELLAELPFEGRLLFQGLWNLADREGRLEDRPLRIKAEVFPFDNVKVDDLLAGLAERGFILRYTAEAVAVIQVVKFSEHQTPHPRETLSVLPKPCLGHVEARPRTPVSVSVLVSVSDSKDSSEPPSAASEPVLVFPCVGQRAEWVLRTEHVTDWQALYPPLDVLAECRKALAWLHATPSRRKTAGGMPRFLVGWLNRSADDCRQAPRGAPDRRSYTPTAHPNYDQWPAECRSLHNGECGNYQAHSFRMMRDEEKTA